MADLSIRGNKAEFSEALLSRDYVSANTAGKDLGTFPWEELSCWPFCDSTMSVGDIAVYPHYYNQSNFSFKKVQAINVFTWT